MARACVVTAASSATWRAEVASICPEDPWSLELLRCPVNLGYPVKRKRFWSSTVDLDLSIKTAFKVKAGPWGKEFHLIPDLLTVLENKVSFVCFFLSHALLHVFSC